MIKFEYKQDRAIELLRLGTTIQNAQFRSGQEESIRTIVEGEARLLLIQKTGWGKSYVYFISTKLLREQGAGPVLLISPLIVLMRSQRDAAKRMGLNAEFINSDNQEDWEHIENDFRNNKIDILLISPERLRNEEFRRTVLIPCANSFSLLVVDEAHCISDWGHDFRPDYRLIESIVRHLPPNLRLLATTATANSRVMKDLENVLGKDLIVIHGDLNRESLTLQTIKLPLQEQRLAWISEKIHSIEGTGIIYTLTVRDAKLVAKWLQKKGVLAEAYTSNVEDREQLEKNLLENRVKVLVATTALGMGFDKPDLAFVIHYQTPGSVVAYYQQVGRAGRAVKKAYGILLSGTEETDISNWFSRTAFPTKNEVEKILGKLEDAPSGLTLSQLMGEINLKKGRIQKCLLMLSLESPAPIVKDGKYYKRTAASVSEEFWKRAERLYELRQNEICQMQHYVTLPFGEHMKYLVQALDGDVSKVTSPRLSPLSESVDERLQQEARQFLDNNNVVITPRKKWPNQPGLQSYGLVGSICSEHQTQEGRALCIWGNSHWGTLVEKGKYQHGVFSEDLVKACVNLLLDWKPSPRPMWVTCVPSLRHPELVPDFARRLASAIGLPFKMAIVKVKESEQQKLMENSIQQATNLDGCFIAVKEEILSGPVLLIDDMVDSRWTMTLCAWLLQSNGSGKVFPLALAQTGQEE